MVPPRGLNTSWYLHLNHWAVETGWAHGFMHVWALWLGLVVMAGLDVLAYLLARRKLDAPRFVAGAALTGLAAVLGLILNQPLAHAVGEVRPYAAHPSALVLVTRAHDFSFPSDHATVAGAVMVGLLIYGWRLGVPALVAGLFLGFARVYVGAHYPGDVVAGFLYGGVIAVLVWAVLRRPLEAAARWLARSPARPLIVARTRPGQLSEPPASG